MEDDLYTLSRMWLNVQGNFNDLLLVIKRVVTILFLLHNVNQITINLRVLTNNCWYVCDILSCKLKPEL
jgi:hypothetical protein